MGSVMFLQTYGPQSNSVCVLLGYSSPGISAFHIFYKPTANYKAIVFGP